MNIKEVLKNKGITIQDAANKMGVDRVTLSRTINNNPTVATLRRLSAAVGVPIVEFFADEQPNSTPQPITPAVCPHCGQPLKIAISCAASPVPEIGTHTQP